MSEKTYTTAKGTQVTLSGDVVTAGKTKINVSHFVPLAESKYRSFWEASFRRAGRSPDEIGLVALDRISIAREGNEEIIRDLYAASKTLRDKIAAETAAREADRAAKEAAVIAGCPEGFEVARSQGWLDGIVTLVAADGATISAWDDSFADQGCGIYYIPSEKFAQSRVDRAATAERNAKAAAEKRAKFDSALATAKASGKPVELRRWVTDRCMNGNEANECSFDAAVESVYPDGQVKVSYTCCY